MNKTLINSVVRRVGGRSQAIEAGEYGADAGWSGFTYYKDTCSFTAKHRAEIRQAIQELANDLGENTIKIIQSFGCLKDQNISDDAVHFALYGGRYPKDLRNDVELVENALAWFALEEVGRYLADQRQ